MRIDVTEMGLIHQFYKERCLKLEICESEKIVACARSLLSRFPPDDLNGIVDEDITILATFKPHRVQQDRYLLRKTKERVRERFHFLSSSRFAAGCRCVGRRSVRIKRRCLASTLWLYVLIAMIAFACAICASKIFDLDFVETVWMAVRHRFWDKSSPPDREDL